MQNGYLHVFLCVIVCIINCRLQITRTVALQKKAVDDVLGGDDAWKNVAKTDGESWLRNTLPWGFADDWCPLHVNLLKTAAGLHGHSWFMFCGDSGGWRVGCVGS